VNVSKQHASYCDNLCAKCTSQLVSLHDDLTVWQIFWYILILLTSSFLNIASVSHTE
jgi:hypothetical protein